MTRHDVRPIFVVGCPRSGTTLLRLMLDSHPAISCGPETHFVAPLQQVMDRWPALSRFGFEREYWYEKLADFVDSFQSDYARRRGKRRWADKTPLYALHLDFVNDLFPRSQVVHLIRDGRDVVASHRDSWGYRSALGASDKWRRFVTAARSFGDRAEPDRYLEIRYEDLVDDPEATMRATLAFLGEAWDDAVLRYDDAAHDVYPGYAAVTDEHRRSDGDESLIYRSRVSGGGRLDPVLRQLFTVRAGRLAAELGYT